MTAARPFSSANRVAEAAARAWRALSREDWLEAFSAHPAIGERTADPRAASEQAGTRSAAAVTLDELARLNQEYREKFGYIYIVRASGKSAEEMLDRLRARLPNDPGREIGVAAEEQLAIAQSRIEKIGL